MSRDKKLVLMVCTGNTCRSPLAEGLFREAVAGRDDIEVASAGISACGGSPMSAESAALLSERGIDVEGFRSQPVTSELIEQATFIFAMTQRHLERLEAEFPAAEGKCFLICEFCESADGQVGGDVPDPIGCGVAAYRAVATTLDRAIPTLVQFIDQTCEGSSK